MPSPQSDPPRAPSIRPLAKLFAASGPLWVLDRDGRIAYASAECGRWLGIDPEHLLGRDGRSSADPAAESADLLDMIAAAMAAPAGVDRGQLAVQVVRPPAASPSLPAPVPRPVLYVPLFAGGLPAATQAAITQVSASPIAAAPSAAVGELAAILAVADLTLPAGETAETAESRALIDAVHRQLAATPKRASSIVTLGSSVAAVRLNRQMEAASRSFTHVTLVGPPGNPVEWIVRRIHAATPHPMPDAIPPGGSGLGGSGLGGSGSGGSASSAGPLVPVAGALMDAELFDATTGTVVDRLLHSDTATAALLIHEIDQMPRDAQLRLELLINNHPRRLRVFATTGRPTAGIGEGLLPSVAALIGTFELALPALVDRVEDVPLLAAALLERRRAAGETRAEQLGRDAVDRLVLYPWPGNFLELDEAIRTAARQCRGATIRVEHLPLAIRSFGAADPGPTPAARARPKSVPLDQALERLERESIRSALEQVRGNRAAAARLLQISRPRLLRRIDQLALDRPEQNGGPVGPPSAESPEN